jgi:hypothetical protein
MRVPVYLVTGWYDNNYGPVGATRGFNGTRLQAATPEARERNRGRGICVGRGAR